VTEPPPLSAAREPLAATYDVALVDLDGVVYRGPEPVEYAPRSLAAAVQLGLRIAFVTNNALRRPEQVADHLTALGVPATGDDVVTSAQACIALLATAAPGFRRVLVLGGDGLDSAVLEAGATVVRSYDDNPDAVVQGLKPTLTYADLGEACLALRAGVPWVAANLDSADAARRAAGHRCDRRSAGTRHRATTAGRRQAGAGPAPGGRATHRQRASARGRRPARQ
jgi:ribonucleotide monophosphatase NagD (HAD superfamily)